MSELRLDKWRMLAADMGVDNPLPPLHPLQNENIIFNFQKSVPAEDRKYMGYGLDAGLLPYSVQDGYNRKKKPRDFLAIILENDVLKATFLPELGGRLWSLFHKPKNRELLYVNEVFQPCNLAVRNAWFSGGIEWNASLYGHSPFTCSPIFAAALKDDDGTPVLRMYEWERIRQVPYQMDFYLPDGSEMLLVRIRIINPHENEIPMYWWSNTAIKETPGLRVLTPADMALHFDCERKTHCVPVPKWNGNDITYPENHQIATDFFSRIDDDSFHWEAAIEKDGCGLIQASTPMLRGRKFFVWGQGVDGNHWKEFLSIPDSGYVEIQAGLARTQLECVPMPAKTEWSWLEAYGLMETDAGIAHGENWNTAVKHVRDRLEQKVTQDWLLKELKRTAVFADKKPSDILFRGSGWGHLECLRRESVGQKPFCSLSLSFDAESMNAEQGQWMELLRSGCFPYRDTDLAPISWMVQRDWQKLLEETVRHEHSNHWFSWLHLGVMYYGNKEFEKAEKAWERSIELEESAWAYRNLAVLALDNKDNKKAADLWLKAYKLKPDSPQLIIGCFQILVQGNRAQEVLDIYGRLDENLQKHWRIKLWMAHASLQLNDFETVEKFFNDKPVFTDIRENEKSITQLWLRFHEKRIAVREGLAIDEKLTERVKSEFPMPNEITF